MKQLELPLGMHKINGVKRSYLGRRKNKASTLVADWWFRKIQKKLPVIYPLKWENLTGHETQDCDLVDL